MLLSSPRRRGHNLLEVTLACFIFATVVILFLGVWASFYRAQGQARNRLAATSLGRAVLEQKVAAGYDANDPALPQDPVVTVISSSEVRGRPASCELKYQFLAQNATVINYRRLLVGVTWSDSTGNHTLNYETYLYRTN